MEKIYKFKISYAYNIGYGAVDLDIKINKFDSLQLEKLRKDIIEHLYKEGETFDPDSFFILGWSRIYNE